MPVFERPRVRVVALANFIAAPGRPAAIGELVEMDEIDARRAIASGNAREATDEDRPRATPLGVVETRDPLVRNREPQLLRRK